jgi:hypothetical protein
VKIDITTSTQAVTDKINAFLGELARTNQQAIRQYPQNNTTRNQNSHLPARNPH